MSSKEGREGRRIEKGIQKGVKNVIGGHLRDWQSSSVLLATRVVGTLKGDSEWERGRGLWKGTLVSALGSGYQLSYTECYSAEP